MGNNITHLTAFIGYKAGMTHVLRELNRISSKSHKKEIVEPVTIIETPPMIAVGFIGYQKTLRGLKGIGTVWANKLDDSFRKKYYKNWKRSKKQAFEKAKQKSDEEKKKH